MCFGYPIRPLTGTEYLVLGRTFENFDWPYALPPRFASSTIYRYGRSVHQHVINTFQRCQCMIGPPSRSPHLTQLKNSKKRLPLLPFFVCGVSSISSGTSRTNQTSLKSPSVLIVVLLKILYETRMMKKRIGCTDQISASGKLAHNVDLLLDSLPPDQRSILFAPRPGSRRTARRWTSSR